jgi:uncharacterized protein
MTLSRIRFAVGTLGLLLFCAFGAQAQSSNCGEAKTADEVLICQNHQLSWRDKEMAHLVSMLRKSMSAKERRVLDAEQHSWRRARMSCGKDVYCIEDHYDQRIHQLLTVGCLRERNCSRW